MIDSTPAFLRGVFDYTGAGYDSPSALPDSASYTVPGSKRSQTLYFRAGNSGAAMVNVVLLRDGKVMRYFPVGAGGAIHVPLSVVEDLEPDQRLTLMVGSAKGATGTIVFEIGLIEI